MPIQLAQVLKLWAKTDRERGLVHPLLCHMVESAAVASVIWDEALAPTTREIIAAGWGLDAVTLTNRLYPLADIRQGLLLLGFQYLKDVTRGADGDSESASLWRGPLDVLLD